MERRAADEGKREGNYNHKDRREGRKAKRRRRKSVTNEGIENGKTSWRGKQKGKDVTITKEGRKARRRRKRCRQRGKKSLLFW